MSGRTLLLLGSLCLVASTSVSAPQTPKEARCREISGYRKWHKANAKPFAVWNPLAALCRGATQAEKEEAKANPHLETFITVFVNDKAKQTFAGAKGTFPVGSIVVKEKWVASDGNFYDSNPKLKLKLMTVMQKREKGYHPSGGDWEYLVVGGNGNLQERGKIQRCQSCHQKQKASDFLFKSYMEGTGAKRI